MNKKQDCFCSFCKNPRKIKLKRHISLMDLVFVLLGAVLLSFIFWQKLDPRLMVAFVILAAIAEVFTQMVWRLNMVCPFCGFDPILYSKEPAKACDKVKAYMNIRKSQSTYILSSSQYGKLAKLRIKKDSDEISEKNQINTEVENS